MNKGREILSGSVEELHGRLDARPRVRLTLEDSDTVNALREDLDVEDIAVGNDDPNDVQVRLRDGAAVAPFLARAVTRVGVRSISTEPPRLHDIFVRAIREDDYRRFGSAP